MIGSINDAVSSAGLLLAALALILAAWTPAIDAALAGSLQPGDAGTRQKSDIKSILNLKSRPLAIASWLVAALFVPRVIDILGKTVECATAVGQACGYNDVAAVFLMTQGVIVILAIHASYQAIQLHRKAA